MSILGSRIGVPMAHLSERYFISKDLEEAEVAYGEMEDSLKYHAATISKILSRISGKEVEITFLDLINLYVLAYGLEKNEEAKEEFESLLTLLRGDIFPEEKESYREGQAYITPQIKKVDEVLQQVTGISKTS